MLVLETHVLLQLHRIVNINTKLTAVTNRKISYITLSLSIGRQRGRVFRSVVLERPLIGKSRSQF